MRTTDFQKYHEFVLGTAIFQPNRGITYCVTKLAGEIGEVNDKLSKVIADNLSGDVSDEVFGRRLSDRQAIVLELGDVTWYVAALANELGSSIVVLRKAYAFDPVSTPDGHEIIGGGLRLSALVGNILETTGKFIRDKGGDGTNTSFLADQPYTNTVLTYLSAILDRVDLLAAKFGHEITDVLEANVKKLTDRRERGTLRGSGDNR